MKVVEEEERLCLWAELPGMSLEDLKLTANAKGLTLEGERKLEVPEGYELRHRERQGLKFAHTFSFPCPVDVEGISASLRDGILHVELPKAPEARPRQISIAVS